MPRFDETGPNGLGPISGRGMGKCRHFSECKRGRGFGFGRNFAESAESLDLQEKVEALKMRNQELAAEIEVLEKKLK